MPTGMMPSSGSLPTGVCILVAMTMTQGILIHRALLLRMCIFPVEVIFCTTNIALFICTKPCPSLKFVGTIFRRMYTVIPSTHIVLRFSKNHSRFWCFTLFFKYLKNCWIFQTSEIAHAFRNVSQIYLVQF